MEFRLDKGVGYMYCYNPSHPLANKAGKVYEHRYVMSLHLGRWLSTEEVVHHKDKNRTNNNIHNLELTNARDHAISHAIENGTVYQDRLCGYCRKPLQQQSVKIKDFVLRVVQGQFLNALKFLKTYSMSYYGIILQHI